MYQIVNDVVTGGGAQQGQPPSQQRPGQQQQRPQADYYSHPATTSHQPGHTHAQAGKGGPQGSLGYEAQQNEMDQAELYEHYYQGSTDRARGFPPRPQQELGSSQQRVALQAQPQMKQSGAEQDFQQRSPGCFSKQEQQSLMAKQYELWQKKIKDKNNLAKQMKGKQAQQVINEILNQSPFSQSKILNKSSSQSSVASSTKLGAHPNNIYTKLYQNGLDLYRKRNEAYEQNRLEQQKREVENVHFHPSITQVNTSHRNTAERIEDYLLMEGKKKQERINQASMLKHEKALENCTFSPNVSKESQIIAKNRQLPEPLANITDIHERLYQEASFDRDRKEEWQNQKFQ